MTCVIALQADFISTAGLHTCGMNMQNHTLENECGHYLVFYLTYTLPST